MDYQATKATFELAGREFPRVTWYKQKGMRGVYVRLFFVVLTSATNGYDGSMMNGLQILPQWEESFHHPSPSHIGLLLCIMSVGSLVAIPFVPYVADGLGRRRGVMVGCFIMLLGVLLQGTGFNFGMFVAARFIIGFGVAIAHGSSPMLITELVHPQHRGIYTTMYNALWYIGAIVAAWLTFGTNNIMNAWSWRIPSIVQGFPSLLQLIFIWTVPESPRWLIAKGRHEEALTVLANVHAMGNKEDEVVRLEYHEIEQTIKLEQEYEGNGWTELFKTPGNRHRVIILVALGFFSQWSGNGLVSYYIVDVLDSIGVTEPTKQLYINGILSICNAIVAIGMCFFVDRLGRRFLFLVSTFGMLIMFTVLTICAAEYAQTKEKGAATAVIVMIFVYYVCYNLAWSGLLVGYGVEILPYRIRAKGLTLMFLCVDIALFFNQYVNPIALSKIAWKYYVVYCVWLAFECAVVWKFFIETRNTPLEEIVKHFDGDDATLGGLLATNKSKKLAENLGLGVPSPVDSKLDENGNSVAHTEKL